MNKARESWMKQKKLGRRKYVLIYGVGVCLFFSILYSVLTIFFNPNPSSYTLEGIIARFIVFAIIFGLAGVVYGNYNWNYKSKYFERSKT